MARAPIIGVMGGNEVQPKTYEHARELGRHIARLGAIVLSGARGGVMVAAATGAKEAGGLTIGVHPAAQGQDLAPFDCLLYTGLGEARNVVNVRLSDIVVALDGEAGTLSEIALALKVGRPVIAVGAWQFLARQGFAILYCETPDEAAAAIAEQLRRIGELGAHTSPDFPDFPDQSSNRKALEAWLLGSSGTTAG